MEGSCNVHILFNLLLDCGVQFFSGIFTIPEVACCSGVEMAVKTEVECLCTSPTDRMLLVISLITSIAMRKEMSGESLVYAHDPSLVNGNNNGYSEISTGPLSPRVSMEASCNINIVFNLNCVPFFSGTSSIPEEAEVECYVLVPQIS
ncbi:unnamed protein product [Cuscuta epithymum]|uniref:Bifunctional inhibitor/plant lipid transfer protein/seed storage helical domain-containing protein n=1 Tax=Cuscuta epithymum TaxID=186058 RepID=A0AAV0FG88_9ASTE|nr:unnamed protein product [Cuscuta epithymum]